MSFFENLILDDKFITSNFLYHLEDSYEDILNSDMVDYIDGLCDAFKSLGFSKEFLDEFFEKLNDMLFEPWCKKYNFALEIMGEM